MPLKLRSCITFSPTVQIIASLDVRAICIDPCHPQLYTPLPTLRKITGPDEIFRKTNYTRPEMTFWVCLVLRSESA